MPAEAAKENGRENGRENGKGKARGHARTKAKGGPTPPIGNAKTSAAGSAKATAARPPYAKLVRGYMGFLTGTGKSLATISSYRGDLDLFEKFLREKKRDFYRLSPRDLEAYHVWLEKQGLKTNTRRRKILSAKALVKYAVSRKKLAPSTVQYVRAPERLERLPWIPSREEFTKVLSVCEPKAPLALRNWLLVKLLSETGLSLAELCVLRWDQCNDSGVAVEGKRPRRLAIEAATAQRLKEWRDKNPGKHIFPGYNRHGITSEKMTPRGVELFFRVLARTSGFRFLKPKTLRHYCVVEWLREGLTDAEVQKRLGVHPTYSLHAYRKVLERDQPQS
jgi:integrase/recombinase XerD